MQDLIKEANSNELLDHVFFVIKDRITGRALCSAKSEEEAADAIHFYGGQSFVGLEAYEPGFYSPDGKTKVPIIIHHSVKPPTA